MEWIKAAVCEKISELGVPVILRGAGGNQETRAILDPVHSVSEAARSTQGLPDGYFLPGSYQYFGLPEGDLTDVTTVVAGESCYILRRKELYQVGGQKLYWWGLMIRGGESYADT